MLNYREDAAGIAFAPDYSYSSQGFGYGFAKRAIDIIASGTAIILLCIPMLIIALLIRLDSKGPVIFRQSRVGRCGESFCIYKFRTMKSTAPSEVPTEQLAESYIYITRIGAILRKTSLDELPQLFNVLRGDMSFVGPRPLIDCEQEIHELRMAKGVYTVRPGITGLAQVSGRDNVSAEEKVGYDAQYVENYSFAADLSILLRTVAVVFTGDGYAEGAQRHEMNARGRKAA